jgi:uncharacterized membrane protein YkoI
MKITMTRLIARCALLALMSGSAAPALAQAPAAAHKVDLSKYPAAVRTTIEGETKNATLKGVSREVEKGKTQYEVETLVNGKSRDLIVDPSGTIIEVEEEIALESAPAPVQDAIKKRGTVLKLESVSRGGVTTYEASVKGASGRKSSLALDAEGRPIAP